MKPMSQFRQCFSVGWVTGSVVINKPAPIKHEGSVTGPGSVYSNSGKYGRLCIC